MTVVKNAYISPKILVISYFYDDLNTNSICLKEVINSFRKRGLDVSILSCHKGNGDDISSEDVYLIPSVSLRLFERIRTFYSRSILLNCLRYVLLGFCRHIGIEKYFESIFLNKRSIWYACDLIKKLGVTHIVSISNPFSNHYLANQIKKRMGNINWTMYQLDPHTFNFGITDDQKAERLNEELNLSLDADKIILTDGIYDDEYKIAFNPLEAKIIKSVPLPNLTLRTYNCNKEEREEKKGCITLLFAGNVYGNIRNPDVLMKLLMSVNDPKLVLEVYGWGMETILEKYESLRPFVNIHGRVSKEEIEKAIASASILINLGNIMANQTPSKVFDYISSGRPIINFSFSEKDTSLRYLERYPLFLNIFNDEANNQEVIEQFRAFCYKNSNRFIPQDVICALYFDLLSANVCKDIERFITE